MAHRRSAKILLRVGLTPVACALLAGTLLAGSFDGFWFDTRFGKEWALEESSSEILIRFEPAADALDRELLARRYGLTATRPYHPGSRTGGFAVGAGADAPAVAAQLVDGVLVADAVAAVVDQEGYTKYYLPGEVTVQFRRGVTREDALAKIAAAGSIVLQAHRTVGYYTIGVRPGQTVFDAVRAWYRDPDVLFSEPSYMVYDDPLSVPNDPLFGDQWAHRNTGQNGWSEGADVEATLAWEITTGSPNVIICVIDTGMDLYHEDLAGNLLPRNGDDWDFASDDESPDDEGDHGTACSGIAAAVQNNDLGVSGIAPSCRIMPLRIDLVAGHNQNRADAINYAASRRGEFAGLVMSCSWRMGSGDFTAVHNAIVTADSLDCVMVFASGNGNEEIVYPAKYEETIACGASSPCDERKTPTSCDGETNWGSCYGPELDVIAPGVKIATTDRTGVDGYSTGNYAGTFGGTSAATPLAAGICALIWSVNPDLTAHEVRAILAESAEDQVGPSEEDAPGWDPYFGWGRVNAYRAVVAAGVIEEFEDDMEEGEGSWNHAALGGGYDDAWHLSQARNHTEGGSTSYKCGAAGDEPYGTAIHAELVSPLIQLGENAGLLFWHWMDLFAVNDSTAGDGALIEVSTNGGIAWSPMRPSTGSYDHVWRTMGGPFFAFTRLWSGSFGWRQVFAPLDEYGGEVVRFRFRMGTRGEEPTGEGWYVDDVLVHLPGETGAGETVRLFHDLKMESCRPNPFSPSTLIRYRLGAAAAVRVEVFDVAGRLVRRWDRGVQEAGSHEMRWDGADGGGRKVAAGVYMAKVTAGRLAETVRMVLLR